MTLPTTLRVGYRDYAVEVKPHKEANAIVADGLCDNANARIWVSDDRTGIDRVETFIHEALHAIWHTSDIHAEDGEERIVTRFASGIIQVCRDNPEVVALLASLSAPPTSWRGEMANRLDEMVEPSPPEGDIAPMAVRWWRNRYRPD